MTESVMKPFHVPPKKSSITLPHLCNGVRRDLEAQKPQTVVRCRRCGVTARLIWHNPEEEE